MFSIAFLIGIYSYLVFLLGILGLLSRNNILVLSILYLFISSFYYRKNIFKFLKFSGLHSIPKDKVFTLSFLLIILSLLMNLIGALGPELSFDALWYHLTLPKIFLEKGNVFFIEGGLLYYSLMPKLGEMLYLSSLALGNEITAKLIHYSFGLLILLGLYQVSKKFFNRTYSILVPLVLAGNLVFAWQQTVAYIDLVRTFFELMSVWAVLNWLESKEKKWLLEGGFLMGLSISTKLLSFTSLASLSLVLLVVSLGYKEKISVIFKKLSLFVFPSLLIPLPWFVFSYLNSGNPFYPLFSDFFQVNFQYSLLNPLNFIKETFHIFTKASDPLSPLYIVFLPFLVLFYKKMDNNLKFLSLYSLFGLLLWYFTPRTGGGRFILPYLPIFSILVIYSLMELKKIKISKNFLLGLVFFASLITILYRGAANFKYVPVILGFQSKNDFLSRNLNFSFGDFYDTDGFFRDNIEEGDRVLLYGFHNLYYINFPYVHESWIKKGESFNYIAIQNTHLPERFKNWQQIYSNETTNVKVYSLEGEIWQF